MSSNHNQCNIFIIDDDEAVRDSLRWLLEANGYQVKCYASAEAFLNIYDTTQLCAHFVGVRVSGVCGLAPRGALMARNVNSRMVFSTVHGDVPRVVSTMKKGAIEFLDKPFNEAELRTIVARMIDIAVEQFEREQERIQHEEVLARLTAREQQVLERIVAGRLNKQIAGDLDISIKTVEAHRANIMEKLEVTTVADLMKIALAPTGEETT